MADQKGADDPARTLPIAATAGFRHRPPTPAGKSPGPGDSPAEPDRHTSPVREAEGTVIHEVLESMRTQNKDRWTRTLGRIGLGREPTVEVATLPLQFTMVSATTRDGSLDKPIEAHVFASLERDGRVVGGMDAGKPQVDVSRLEEEPEYCAGVGPAREVPGIPSMLYVLAIGTTPREAASRCHAIAAKMEELGKNLALTIGRVSRLDGQLLRKGMEEALETATGDGRAAVEMGLGRTDDLIDEDGWITVPPDIVQGMADDEVCKITVNADGHPQVWDCSAEPDPYWADNKAD